MLEATPLLTGSDVRQASAAEDQYGGRAYHIGFELLPEGALRMAEWSGKNVGERLAIVFDDEIKSAPTVQGQLSDRGQISGQFSKAEAEDLAIILNAGSLPHKLTLRSESGFSKGN